MLSLRKALLKILIVSLGLCLVPALASADVREFQEGTERDGFIIGLGAGVGHMQCDGIGCEDLTEAGGVNLQLGLMASSRFAIMTDVWGMAHSEDRLTLTQGIATVGPQVWLLDRLWLRAGVGVARSGWNYDAELVDISDRSEFVPAATGALGFEVVSTNDFALDVQLRAGSGFMHEDADDRIQNYSLGLGATWY